MFHWTECRCHSNAAGNKSALNNGFDLFSENPVHLDFFHHLSLETSEQYWPIDTGLVKF